MHESSGKQAGKPAACRCHCPGILCMMRHNPWRRACRDECTVNELKDDYSAGVEYYASDTSGCQYMNYGKDPVPDRHWVCMQLTCNNNMLELT